MYLLLSARTDGAALQELTADGTPAPADPEPRLISAAVSVTPAVAEQWLPRGGSAR